LGWVSVTPRARAKCRDSLKRMGAGEGIGKKGMVMFEALRGQGIQDHISHIISYRTDQGKSTNRFD